MPTPRAEKNSTLIFIAQRPRSVCVSFLFLLWFLCFFPCAGFASTDPVVASTSSSILALDSARQTAVIELEKTTLSDKESADYLDFIVYLNTRIMAYCQELEQLGALTELAELPCPAASAAGATQADAGATQADTDSTQGGVSAAQSEADSAQVESGKVMDQTGDWQDQTITSMPDMADAQTEGEKTAALQDQFLAALGEFDDMLLKEDAQIASRIPSQRESGRAGGQGSSQDSTGAGDEGDGSGESSSALDQGGEVAAGEVTGEAGDGAAADGTQTPGGSVATTREQSSQGVPEGRVPPPKDDDIVARQLREAAEKEPDPELKKKLWEEYWKYKGVTPKGG